LLRRIFANLDALLTQSDNEIQFPAERQIRHFHYGNVNGKRGGKGANGSAQSAARRTQRFDRCRVRSRYRATSRNRSLVTEGDIDGAKLLLCNLIHKPHFAGRKTLL
jgi:hypothetical protein